MNDIVQRNVRFRQNIGNALVRRRQRGGLFEGTEVRNCLHARIEVCRTGRTTRQYRLNGIDGVAFVLIPGAEASQHEVDNIIDHVAVRQLIAVQAHRFFGEGLQIQIEVLLNDDAQHAQRGAAQRERVFVAFRVLTNPEDTRQSIHLVGNRQRAGYRI